MRRVGHPFIARGRRARRQMPARCPDGLKQGKQKEKHGNKRVDRAQIHRQQNAYPEN